MPKSDPLIPRNMARAITRYEAEATKILQAFLNTVESKKPPPLLYHYTDDTGLAGIIESGRLRFSDIFALNDPSELRHGLSVAIDILKSRAAAGRPEIETFARMFERFDLDAGIEAAGHFFICCFSGDGDDLGQWRAYADNGQGFALAFHTASLEDVFTKKQGKPIKQHSTFPMTYDDEKLKRISDRAGRSSRSANKHASDHGRPGRRATRLYDGPVGLSFHECYSRRDVLQT
jgi:hypothetical protein